MMIDYLKWDNCTVSSDEEDEESTEDEGVSHTSTTSVVNETPAVTEAGTTKISSGPTKASKPQHIPIILPYVNCSTMVNSTDMQYCSRCKVRRVLFKRVPCRRVEAPQTILRTIQC